jgi:hypothetical protein
LFQRIQEMTIWHKTIASSRSHIVTEPNLLIQQDPNTFCPIPQIFSVKQSNGVKKTRWQGAIA